MGAEITNQKRKHRTKDIQYHIIGKKNSDIVLPPNIAMFNVQNLSQYPLIMYAYLAGQNTLGRHMEPCNTRSSTCKLGMIVASTAVVFNSLFTGLHNLSEKC